ncbi:uncharacterized protein LOC133422299 [Cololabis saira]|uniref:uncharacterized protein LOC133422299 n=1 Tax=Cololabis saira TaxID=129043 RepID=UPI002AD4DE12|nr:uncharacterized protein LOC133422299 [Cololabis saira]
MTSKRVKLSFQRREESTASHHCCVPRCTASAKFNSVLSFHTFPRDKETRRKWLTNIRREHCTLTNNTRVCSLHFQSCDLIQPSSPCGRRRLKNGAIPVRFHWNNFTPADPHNPVWEEPERPNRTFDHDYCRKTKPYVLDSSPDHIVGPSGKVFDSKFCLEQFDSDEDIRFYTRFASHAHLMAFWRQIEPATRNISYVSTACSVGETDDGPYTVTKTLLQPIDQFFLFMIYLSLGLMPKDLAHRFRIHQSTVCRIIHIWAYFLYTLLGGVSIWLDEEVVSAHRPHVFEQFPDTHVILNCMEVHCQTPNPRHLKSESFSSYESKCTFKGLIGMAPHGAVTFVSSLNEGAISDREILQQSGILSLLKPTMALIIDKGFHVRECVPCKVHTASFLSKREALSQPEVVKTQSARLRVHVDSLIQRVKQHQIFSTVIPFSLSGSINQLYTVACLLVNYQNGPQVKA